MNGTFILEGLPGHKVEGITHVHLHHSKVIIPPVFLHACSKAMNNLLSSRRAGNSKLKNSVALCLVRVHKLHFPVSLLRTSPTAMGLISWALPSFSLFKAVRLPPARYLETRGGALPDARRVTMSLRKEHMEVGRGMFAASRRCWTRRPEGPAAVPLGNERRAPKMLKSGSMDMGIDVT